MYYFNAMYYTGGYTSFERKDKMKLTDNAMLTIVLMTDIKGKRTSKWCWGKYNKIHFTLTFYYIVINNTNYDYNLHS